MHCLNHDLSGQFVAPTSLIYVYGMLLPVTVWGHAVTSYSRVSFMMNCGLIKMSQTLELIFRIKCLLSSKNLKNTSKENLNKC